MVNYEIWHVQDYHDIGRENIDYIKITGIPEKTLELTQKLADKNISYMEDNMHLLAPYYDRLYIIKSGDNIITYEGDEYYDMHDLHYRIKRVKENIILINRYKNCFLVIGFIIWLFTTIYILINLSQLHYHQLHIRPLFHNNSEF